MPDMRAWVDRLFDRLFGAAIQNLDDARLGDLPDDNDE